LKNLAAVAGRQAVTVAVGTGILSDGRFERLTERGVAESSRGFERASAKYCKTVGLSGDAPMRSHHLVRLGMIAAVLGAASPALAARFECPKKGGDLVFGGEAKVNSLDQYASNAISTRNVAMNLYESLMTRDEKNEPILELADAMTESPDHLSYTFTLRQVP
jgi:hypothetical protein